jgi:hypothetical protein
MKKLVLAIVAVALLSGCAAVSYTPFGIYVKTDAPLEVVVYGHRVDRNPTNAFVQALTTLAQAGAGGAMLANGLSSAGFTIVQSLSIVLDRQNRDRYEARIRADKELVGHILAIVVVPAKDSQPKMLILTDLDPGNPSVKETLAEVLLDTAWVDTAPAQ